MIFKKDKMIARLTEEGKAHLIDEEIMEIMNNLDGKEVVKNDYKALIHDVEEYMVQYNGEWYPVNKLDCE